MGCCHSLPRSEENSRSQGKNAYMYKRVITKNKAGIYSE